MLMGFYRRYLLLFAFLFSIFAGELRGNEASRPPNLWKRKVGCAMALAIPISLGGLYYTWIYETSVPKNNNTPWVPPENHAPKTETVPFLAPDEDETVFAIQDGEGKYPVLTFLTGSRAKRFIAKKINEAAKEAERDPLIKQQHLITESFRMGFTGIVFSRVPENPGKVKVSLIGEVYETVLTQLYDLKELASGASVKLQYAEPKREYFGLGTAEGSLEVVQRYDAQLGVLRFNRIFVHVDVKPLLSSPLLDLTEAPQEISGLVGVRDRKVVRRPVLKTSSWQKPNSDKPEP